MDFTPSAAADPVFDRPIFIVSPPRSGSTLLFETLQQARGLFTIGGESHALIEGLPQLGVPAHNFDSNRLTEGDATLTVSRILRQRFYAQLHDRDGAAPANAPVRMLEKTPKNALRIPFLRKVFPEAHFVYLHRDARQTLNSMIEAWLSGRFRTYPGLPGWTEPPWSLVLSPDWRASIGKPLAEIVAAQWEATMRVMLDDLEQVPSERLVACRYDALTVDWGREITRLCGLLDLDWDRPTDRKLPNSRFTVSAPDSEKWRARADEIEPLLPALQATIDRAELCAGP